MQSGSGSGAHEQGGSTVHEQMGRHNALGIPDEGAKPDGPLLRIITDRRLAFICVGAVNTAVGLSLFFALHVALGHDRYLATLLGSHVGSVLVAFVLYRRLVYRVHGQVLRDLWRFETVYLLGLAGNAALLALGVGVMKLPVLLCQVVITALQAGWSWLGHGRFSFHRDNPHTTASKDLHRVS